MLRTIIRHKPTPVFLAVWAVLAAPAAVAQQAQQPAAQEAAVTEIVIRKGTVVANYIDTNSGLSDAQIDSLLAESVKQMQ
jgi:hypothetical protein